MPKNEKGFSLLELVVAVAVAGIIAAVAVPTFVGLQGDATTEAASYETTISDNHGDVTNEAGFWNGNGGEATQPTGTGVTTILNGTVLSASVDPAYCNRDNNVTSYYYQNSADGSNYITSNTSGTYDYAANGYSIGQNLGFGVTIIGFFTSVSCDGIDTRSDNTVS